MAFNAVAGRARIEADLAASRRAEAELLDEPSDPPASEPDEGIADEPSGDFLQLRRASVASLETDENTLLLRDIFSQLHELRIASGLAPAGSMPVPGAIVHTPPEVSPRPSVELAAAPAPALTGAPCISVGAPSPPPPIAAPNGNAAGKQPAAAPSPSDASGASPSVPATKLKSALRRASDDVKAARDEPQEDFTGLVNASLFEAENVPRGMIDPEARFRVTWDLLMLALLLYVSVASPMEIFFSAFPKNTAISVVNILIDILFIADIVLNFRTGYIDEAKKLVLDKTRLRRGRRR